MTDLVDTIESNAAQPLQVQSDGESVQQHPLPDQIAADEYVRQQRAGNRRKLPIRLAKIRPDGAL